MIRKPVTVCAGVVALVLCIGASAVAAEAPKEPRIVGGVAARPAAWPFVAAILFQGEQGCGGSVISSTAVLTAAHCVEGERPANVDVVTGRRVLSQTTVGQRIDVTSFRVHPGYASTGRPDFAVLRLASPTTAPAIPLSTPQADAQATAEGSLLRVAGWGSTTPLGGSDSDTMLETAEWVRPGSACRRAYGTDFNVTEQICALGARITATQHRSSCFGDSGGPLAAATATGRWLVGVVSFGGDRCGDPANPSVYARVAPAAGWIRGTG